MNTALKNSLLLLASAIALLSASALRAQSLTFAVDLNTASLSALDGANAPFYLDFTLSYGNSALASNTATLSGFSLTGGTALGSPVITGMASGNLGSTVSLTASSSHTFSELYQQFSSGVTDIKFNATVTETGPDVGIPTEFAVSIFDSSLGFPAPVYTTAPDTASLVTLNLSTSNTISNVNTYAIVSSADGNTTIPEPATTTAIFGCAGLMFVFCARRFGLLGAV
ncbi:MAG TPA: hypothetical protein VK717_08255 [Opitutaceae bacterium]|nr:hypothetical protein [Opitutaceae bacterium]